ncbi:hypothetical protein LQ318_08430 [Aliifodinibius salicampi]|uniref:Uncharacterized protein n=1 Tax=Fodinibius salicampi TaxID=1920655 RepID=A0ABT3PYL2_9BACT|nr:hypothetical protein [Fodinibius salicampi]MCW9712929.1 hypothetical protein [Fodinibius salicampi]
MTTTKTAEKETEYVENHTLPPSKRLTLDEVKCTEIMGIELPLPARDVLDRISPHRGFIYPGATLQFETKRERSIWKYSFTKVPGGWSRCRSVKEREDSRARTVSQDKRFALKVDGYRTLTEAVSATMESWPVACN